MHINIIRIRLLFAESHIFVTVQRQMNASTTLAFNYREWRGAGGTTAQEEGQVKFNSYKKGSEKVLAMLDGAQQVLTWEVEVLAIYTKGRVEKASTLQKGGWHKTF